VPAPHGRLSVECAFWVGEGTENPGADYDGGRQHDYAQILGGRESGVSENCAQQAGAGADGAECEIEALAGAPGSADQPGENGCDREVDQDQD